MKHKGSKCDFIAERNKELIQAYRKAIYEADIISLNNVITTAINTPCSRFWVSPERAAVVMSMMERHQPLVGIIPTRMEMFNELYRRYTEARKRSSLSIQILMEDIVLQPAPKFYLKASSAKVIISKIKKEICKATKLRLRHCCM